MLARKKQINREDSNFYENKQKQINKKTRSEKMIDRLSSIQYNKQLLYCFSRVVLLNLDHRGNHCRWLGGLAVRPLKSCAIIVNWVGGEDHR